MVPHTVLFLICTVQKILVKQVVCCKETALSNDDFPELTDFKRRGMRAFVFKQIATLLSLLELYVL